jgi:hypothetical protein
MYCFESLIRDIFSNKSSLLDDSWQHLTYPCVKLSTIDPNLMLKKLSQPLDENKIRDIFEV